MASTTSSCGPDFYDTLAEIDGKNPHNVIDQKFSIVVFVMDQNIITLISSQLKKVTIILIESFFAMCYGPRTSETASFLSIQDR